MKQFLLLLYACVVQSMNITLDWNTNLVYTYGTAAAFTMTIDDYVILNWVSNHNLHYRAGPCSQNSIDFSPSNGGVVVHSQWPGVNPVYLNFANPGDYCVVCTSHLSSMRFGLTVTPVTSPPPPSYMLPPSPPFPSPSPQQFVVVQSSPPPSPLNLPSPLPPSSSPPSPSPPPPIMPSAPPGFTCSNSCNGLHTSNGICDDGGEGAEWSNCPLGQDCMDCGVRYISPPPIAASSPSPPHIYPPLPLGPQPNAPPLPGLPPLPPDSPAVFPTATAASPPAASPPATSTASSTSTASPPAASSTATSVAPPPSSPMTDRNYFYWIIPILVIIVIINGVFIFLCIRKCQNDSED